MLLRYSLSLGAEAGYNCFFFARRGGAGGVGVFLFGGEEE